MRNLTSSLGSAGSVVLVLLLVAFLIFVGPALLVWGLGAIMQGEGYDLNFWSWLGGLAVILVLKGSSSN